MSKTIEIIVARDGSTTVQTRGFAGGSCREATRLLEKALGQVTKERLTAEFHLTQASQEQKAASR